MAPSTTASPSTKSATCLGKKPMARRVAISLVRSRTPIAIVLPRTSAMIARMTTEMMSKAVRTAEKPARKLWLKACSSWLSV